MRMISFSYSHHRYIKYYYENRTEFKFVDEQMD